MREDTGEKNTRIEQQRDVGIYLVTDSKVQL